MFDFKNAMPVKHWEQKLTIVELGKAYPNHTHVVFSDGSYRKFE
jgi:hypothetical protein